jgi:hypothetical protein
VKICLFCGVVVAVAGVVANFAVATGVVGEPL